MFSRLTNWNFSVRANNFRRRHVIFPIIVFRYGVPLRYRSVKSNARKPGAMREGPTTDARHAVADCHARKPCAIREGIIADARHAVADCHARKPGALIEGIIADARHASVRRNDTCITT